VEGGVDWVVKPGEAVPIAAVAESHDAGLDVAVTYRVYPEASSERVREARIVETAGQAVLHVPENAVTGDQIHVIVKAQNNGHHRLVHYQQVILTVA